MNPDLINAINALTSALQNQNGIAEALVIYTEEIVKASAMQIHAQQWLQFLQKFGKDHATD